MRIIGLDEFDSIELWRGRRLYCTSSAGPQIFALPRGAMTVTRSNTTVFISFGTPTRSTCQITGSERRGRADALARGIIQMERPTGLSRITL